MRILALTLSIGWLATGAVLAENQPLEITIKFVGTQKPTSFPKLLYVHVTNPGYSTLDLGKIVTSSELMIDGKPSKRIPKPFLGKQGLPPMGEWDGCFSMEGFDPPITPGQHKVSLRMSGMLTPETKIRWDTPVPWQKGDMKSRFKEIQQLALALEDGLPQSCAEQWLTRKDGGQQEEDKIRYFLEPQFKMSVPYRQMYEPSGMHAVVDGVPKIYKEQALHD